MIDLVDADRAVRAACALAARFGVRSDAPVLLSNGSNVVVHLAPAPVVARVATLTAAVRPYVATNLATDLAMAGYLTEQGLPVVPPSRELPPGPHRANDRTITFWTYVPHTPQHSWEPHDIGPRLADLHAAMRDFPGELPTFPPIEAREIVAFLRTVDGLGSLGEDDVARLVADSDTIGRELAAAEVLPVHGDAHPGNLLYTPNGPVWTDFEDAWRGPIGWDLACLELTSKLDGRAAVAGYPGPRSDPTSVAGRRLAELVWGMVFRWRFPSDRWRDLDRDIRAWQLNGP